MSLAFRELSNCCCHLQVELVPVSQCVLPTLQHIDVFFYLAYLAVRSASVSVKHAQVIWVRRACFGQVAQAQPHQVRQRYPPVCLSITCCISAWPAQADRHIHAHTTCASSSKQRAHICAVQLYVGANPIRMFMYIMNSRYMHRERFSMINVSCKCTQYIAIDYGH
jgi:hypothetical protein